MGVNHFYVLLLSMMLVGAAMAADDYSPSSNSGEVSKPQPEVQPGSYDKLVAQSSSVPKPEESAEKSTLGKDDPEAEPEFQHEEPVKKPDLYFPDMPHPEMHSEAEADQWVHKPEEWEKHTMGKYDAKLFDEHTFDHDRPVEKPDFHFGDMPQMHSESYDKPDADQWVQKPEDWEKSTLVKDPESELFKEPKFQHDDKPVEKPNFPFADMSHPEMHSESSNKEVAHWMPKPEEWEKPTLEEEPKSNSYDEPKFQYNEPIEKPDLHFPNLPKAEPTKLVGDYDAKPEAELAKTIADYDVKPKVDPTKPVGDYDAKPKAESAKLVAPTKPVGDYDAKPKIEPTKPVEDSNAKPKAEFTKPVGDYDAKPKVESTKPVGDYDAKPKAESTKPVGDYDAKPKAESTKPVGDYDAKPKAEPTKPVGDYDAKPKVESTTPVEPTKPVGDYDTKPKAEPTKLVGDYDAKPKAESTNPVGDYGAKPKADNDAKPQVESTKQVGDYDAKPNAEPTKSVGDYDAKSKAESTKLVEPIKSVGDYDPKSKGEPTKPVGDYDAKPKVEPTMSVGNYEKPKLNIPEPEEAFPAAVEGIVICKSTSGYVPIKGAVVRITCLGVDNEGYEKAPVSCQTSTTDAKGYFFKTLPAASNNNCKAFLEQSPLEECGVPTNVNKGIDGYPLSSHRVLQDKHLKLYPVGPFFYTPEPMAKPTVKKAPAADGGY